MRSWVRFPVNRTLGGRSWPFWMYLIGLAERWLLCRSYASFFSACDQGTQPYWGLCPQSGCVVHLDSIPWLGLSCVDTSNILPFLGVSLFFNFFRFHPWTHWHTKPNALRRPIMWHQTHWLQHASPSQGGISFSTMWHGCMIVPWSRIMDFPLFYADYVP